MDFYFSLNPFKKITEMNNHRIILESPYCEYQNSSSIQFFMFCLQHYEATASFNQVIAIWITFDFGYTKRLRLSYLVMLQRSVSIEDSSTSICVFASFLF